MPETKSKTLIKSGNKIHTLFSPDTEKQLLFPNGLSKETLTQEQFEQWGMDTLEGYEEEINKVAHEMEYDGVLEDGKIYRKTISRDEFLIKKLGVK